MEGKEDYKKVFEIIRGEKKTNHEKTFPGVNEMFDVGGGGKHVRVNHLHS